MQESYSVVNVVRPVHHEGIMEDRDRHAAVQNTIEQKFNDTLEEVFALKRILQEFLCEPETKTNGPVSKSPYGAPESPSHFTFPPEHHDRGEYDAHTNETNQMQPQVRASRNSERLLRRSLQFEPNFHARMRYYMAKREQNKAQLQAEVNEKTTGELKLAPAINQRSKRIHRSVDHLHAWNNERELKLMEMREVERNREVEEVTSAPRISRRSERLTVARTDDLAGCKVEDRLHLLGLIYEYQQEERMVHAARSGAAARCKPSLLAPHSTRLVRQQNEPAHERLHELSKTLIEQSTRKAEQANRKRNVGTVKSKETVDAAVRRLAEIGETYRHKRREMSEQRELQLKEMQESQKLSEASRFLAEKARLDRSRGACEHHRQCPCCQRPEQPESRGIPPVNATKAAAIYDRQVQWKRDKEQRCQEEKERREFNDEAELEFRNPRYRQAWDTLNYWADTSGCDGGDSFKGDSPERAQRVVSGANRSFFEKSVRWAGAREQQLLDERKKWDEIRLQECTFHPNVKHIPRNTTTPVVLHEALRKNRLSLDRGFFSRTNLSTPMLGVDASEVSTDDLIDESQTDQLDEPKWLSEMGRRSSRGTSESSEHIAFFDEGRKMHQ